MPSLLVVIAVLEALSSPKMAGLLSNSFKAYHIGEATYG
jgi:hypothetical protein